MIPFAIGIKARANLEATGSIVGRVKKHDPIIRTEQDEAELEEMIEAQR